MRITRAGEVLNVGAETLDWWVDQGWKLDLNGDGIPDTTGPGGGRGIASSTVTGGHLVFTYTDGSTEDAGPVGGTIALDTDGVPYVTAGA